MSSNVTNAFSDPNIIQNNYDLSKIFIRNNRFDQATFINNTGATASFPEGTLIARNSTTGNIVPWDNDVTANGQSLIIGVLRDDVNDLADTATVENVYFCYEGDVNQSRIIFNDGAQTLDTVIAALNKRVRDVLHDIGIRPIPTTELTNFDNS